MRMAVAVRGGVDHINNVIFHTDCGSSYTASSFTSLCSGLKIRQGMGRTGSCFDNSVAEAWFSTLEWEVLRRHRFRTKDDAGQVISRWVHEFYNVRRQHSTIGSGQNRSPLRFRGKLTPARSAGLRSGPSGSNGSAPTTAARPPGPTRRTAQPVMPIPPPGQRRDSTIYACPSCDTRFHGQQWCHDCNQPCTRVGLGGLCPHCLEPVALSDLFDQPNQAPTG